MYKGHDLEITYSYEWSCFFGDVILEDLTILSIIDVDEEKQYHFTGVGLEDLYDIVACKVHDDIVENVNHIEYNPEDRLL